MFIVPDLKYLPKEISDVLPQDNLIQVKKFDYSKPASEFRKHVFTSVVRDLRHNVETDIIKEFDEGNPDDWLVIDGYISQTQKSDKKIGIIKRHGKEWLDPLIKFNMLKDFVNNNCKKIRSCLFKIEHRTRFRPVIISCYTKLLYDLKLPIANNPEFSVIRMETPINHKDKFEQIINTILNYNSPLCNPSDQWDKKLFPILMAEKILRSFSKNDKEMFAAFCRM